MKKLLLILLTAGLAASMADIQAPPQNRQDFARKFSRGLSNLVYGFGEVPNQWEKTRNREGGSAGTSYGTVWGLHKMATRIAYGLYEVVTFPFPTYKGGYRAPYKLKESTDPYRGYQEFAPEIGFVSGSGYCRSQRE